MYQKILLCVMIICSSIVPASANTADRDDVFTSQDLDTVAAEAKSWKGTRYRYSTSGCHEVHFFILNLFAE